ncbi:HlyD family efflux transporter periplasmic adaptor subunit [Flagellimonas sp. DF-77]|uniref:efflux RND transporter periplasmic adaptor subunit n=1 Tax=Flagellimonas algarum TaxID=3230298 RepID=UPI0033909001
MGKRSNIVLGIAILLLAIVVFVWLNKTEKADRPNTTTAPTRVTTRLAVPVSLPYRLEVTGTVRATHKVELFSEVQGVLMPSSPPFKIGNRFRKNQTLLQLNDREYQAQLLSTKSSLVSQIAAMLPDMEIEFPQASKGWEAYLNSFEMQGPLPELPKTRTDKEKLFITGKGILQTYYNAKNQQERAAKYRIRAPFSGTLTVANVNPGTLIRSGQKLGEFIDPDRFELELAIPAGAFPYVAVGKPVQIMGTDGTGEIVANIDRLNQKVDQGTQTSSAVVGLNGYPFLEGQYLKARIEGETLDQVVRIKANLLMENNQVYIVKDSVLALQQVRLRYYDQDEVIVQGLQQNMVLLDEVLADAYPGMKVTY